MLDKAMRILNISAIIPNLTYQSVLPSIYNFFSKVFMLYGLASRDEKTAAAAWS
jgi:DNA polymerase-3 subunit delta